MKQAAAPKTPLNLTIHFGQVQFINQFIDLIMVAAQLQQSFRDALTAGGVYVLAITYRGRWEEEPVPSFPALSIESWARQTTAVGILHKQNKGDTLPNRFWNSMNDDLSGFASLSKPYQAEWLSLEYQDHPRWITAVPLQEAFSGLTTHTVQGEITNQPIWEGVDTGLPVPNGWGLAVPGPVPTWENEQKTYTAYGTTHINLNEGRRKRMFIEKTVYVEKYYQGPPNASFGWETQHFLALALLRFFDDNVKQMEAFEVEFIYEEQ